jgi:hypothetical protein
MAKANAKRLNALAIEPQGKQGNPENFEEVTELNNSANVPFNFPLEGRSGDAFHLTQKDLARETCLLAS